VQDIELATIEMEIRTVEIRKVEIRKVEIRKLEMRKVEIRKVEATWILKLQMILEKLEIDYNHINRLIYWW
jgi:hypothetical protein